MNVKSFAWVAVPIIGLAAGCKKGESVSIVAPGIHINSTGTHVNISADTDSMQGEAIKASGPITRETRHVTAFHAIDADSIIEVKFTKAETSSIEVSAKENILSHVTAKVENGVLQLSLPGNFTDTGSVVVTITNPDLDAVSASGSSKFEGTGLSQSNLQVSASGSSVVSLNGSVAKLNLDISDSSNVSAPALGDCELKAAAGGSSTAKLAGKFKTASLDAEGSSNLDIDGLNTQEATLKADGSSVLNVAGSVEALTLEGTGSCVMELQKLQVQTATVSADGSTQIHVNVAKTLTATAEGASAIKYEGKPEVKSSLSGAASVSQE